MGGELFALATWGARKVGVISMTWPGVVLELAARWCARREQHEGGSEVPQDDRLDVYLAVGHGVEDNGVYDPGAIGADGRQEHLEAFQVCTHALAGMRRSGLRVVSETAQGASHDPDFQGS